MEMDIFDIGIASRPIIGESLPGDATLILRDGEVLTVALADGLGHGPEARVSADRALEAVQRPGHRSLEDILSDAHARLTNRQARGAVMGIARFDGVTRKVVFAGVGNIDLIVIGSTVTRLIGHHGILGSNIPHLRTYETSFVPGTIALLLSDGIISSKLNPSRYQGVLSLSAHALAEIIVREVGRHSDDATAMVIRG